MSHSKTPLTDSKVFSFYDAGLPSIVKASDCRAIEERLNACVEALEEILKGNPAPSLFREETDYKGAVIHMQFAKMKACEAIAGARRPLFSGAVDRPR